jgi:transposase
VGGLLAQTSVSADAAGYRRLFDFAQAQVPGRRCWAVEGAGSYGAGLAAFLQAHGERVVEVGRPKRPPRRSGAKSDALDAVRAAREALAHDHSLAPRRRGDREALRVLLATRHSACAAKVSAINQLKALIVAAPEELRAELERLVAAIAPWLLELPGVGPISAAQVLVSWSHAGRLRSEAAFAALAGANPIPASSGQVTRHRLNRSGDRQLNGVDGFACQWNTPSASRQISIAAPIGALACRGQLTALDGRVRHLRSDCPVVRAGIAVSGRSPMA